MASRYIIKYNDGAVEMTKPNSTILIYQIPYTNLKALNPGFVIPNRFIVYILFGKNARGKDVLYVGKSKNGLANRPTAHDDKYANWSACYILTQFKERTFFNDGTIQYLEDVLNHRINELNLYHNTTLTTSSGTANTDDVENCDDYLVEVYKMLDILGLDLITNSEEAEAEKDVEESECGYRASDRAKIPDGIYYFARKVKRFGNILLRGEMRVKNGTFMLLKGSDIATETGIGLSSIIDEKRNRAKVEDGKLMEDIELTSPSACGEFIMGASCNGWDAWKTKSGEPIDCYRK